jgi:phosphonopyruvate decarboxylase
MIEIKNFYTCLNKNRINFLVGVPDSLLNDFCLYAEENLTFDQHLIVANEGNAIGVAAGYYLSTGNIPLVYMQNSGIGNAFNPLASLTNREVYSLPLILLIGWRGSPDINDHAHHKLQGALTPVLLDDLNIPYKVLENDCCQYEETINWAATTAAKNQSPVAILVKKGVLAKTNKIENFVDDIDLECNREQAIEALINKLPKDTIFIATTGRATRELYAVREKHKQSHDNDILNVGAMGHVSSLGLGISKGIRNRLICCLDGDAASLMHMGSMAILGTSSETNILHVILNNGVHESVGGQKSISRKIDYTSIADSFGYKSSGMIVKNIEQLKVALINVIDTKGPKFIDFWINKGIRQDLPNLNVELIDIKNNFMKKNI